MFMPKIVVQQLPISFNANLICRNLSPAKAITGAVLADVAAF